MYGQSQQRNEKDARQQQTPSQNWTVHAEFTISHDGLAEQGIGPPIAHTEQDENGAVKLVYRWTSVQAHPSGDEQCNTEYHLTRRTSATDEQQTPNILFTSIPLNKQSTTKQGGYVKNILNKFAAANSVSSENQQQQPVSSGYSSEHLISPNSNSNATINNGARLFESSGRRCRSTCSIVLSTNLDSEPSQTGPSPSTSRTQSLRCQTPMCPKTNSTTHYKGSSLYGCGDPWCYHSPIYDETWSRFSPLIEADEYSTAPTASIKSTAIKDAVSAINVQKSCRDVSVQTYEMVDKCTSPFLFSDQRKTKDIESDMVSENFSLGVIGTQSKSHRPAVYLTRRKTEPIKRCSRNRETDTSMSPDSLDNKKCPIRFVPHQKIPQKTKSPSHLFNKDAFGESSNNSGNLTTQNQTDKKPRTVHIDVYCTGTEQESSSSSSSLSDSNNNENDPVSSPQTVFESSDIRITHIRADPKSLPQKIVQKINQPFSDQEGDSILYPSRLSSYSAIRDLDWSSFSTNPWSRMSLSSCDTSWKDTGSDLVSLLETSRSNDLAVVSTRNFVDQTIREEDINVGGAAITPSSFDSFEYAASEDQARIRKLNKDLLKQKSPQVERQPLLLRKSAALEEVKGLISDSDCSDESDHSGKGWSFIKTNLEREETIKQSHLLTKLGTRQSKGFAPCKSASILIVKQKLSENPELRAPFTQSPGVFTEQRHIARRFGQIIDVYKKPGHHIGPVKNPDCNCNHCIDYFRSGVGRGRTRSISSGDGGMDYYRWKRENGGRGSEPPQSLDEKQLQSEKDGDVKATSIMD